MVVLHLLEEPDCVIKSYAGKREEHVYNRHEQGVEAESAEADIQLLQELKEGEEPRRLLGIEEEEVVDLKAGDVGVTVQYHTDYKAEYEVDREADKGVLQRLFSRSVVKPQSHRERGYHKY